MAALGLMAVGVFGIQSLQSSGVSNFLAQVGVTIGIQPNPYNTLNEQLNARQTQLDEEQADLASREAALTSSTGTSAVSASATPSYLMLAVGVLTFLVGLNFYFDWLRTRPHIPTPP